MPNWLAFMLGYITGVVLNFIIIIILFTSEK